jgi:hypothetical protein
MTVPTFTPTPVITGTGAADMPTALGSQVGDSADSNFAAAGNWGDSLENDLYTAKKLGAILTPAANFAIGGDALYLERFGGLKILRGSFNRTAGTALVSNTVGTITNTTVATMAAMVAKPTLPSAVMVARVFRGPMLNMHINSSNGVIILRGCSQPSYTFAATWSAEFEIWYS